MSFAKKINLKTNLIYFITLCLFVVIRICSNYGVFDFMGDYAGFIMGIVTQIGIIFLLSLVMFKCLNKFSFKNTFDFFKFKKISFKTIVLSVILGLLVFCINIFVASFFSGVIQFFGYHPASHTPSDLPVTWWMLLLDLFVTAVLPAICEETLHRGMLLNGCSQMGIKKAILFSGLLFGLLHLNIEQFFYASLIGIFLGYLCMGCNSIYPCMIVHFMNNGISVFLSFASKKGWAIGSVFNNIFKSLLSNPVLGFVFLMLFLILLVVLAYELTVVMFKESFKYSFSKEQKHLANMAVRENYFKQIDDIKNNTVAHPSFSTDKNVLYIDFKEFVEFISKNIEEKKKQEFGQDQTEKAEEKVDKNLDLKIKILLYGSIALSGIITFMTFIWGLFR